MLRMFKIIDHICRKHDIKYWMCSGTLLGAVRHKRFIPWDDDLDITMPREDYEKFLRVAVDELPEDMMLQTKETDPNYHYLPLPCKVRDKKSFILSPGYEDEQSAKGLYVDIFPADRYNKNIFKFFFEKQQKIYYKFICKCLDSVYYKDESAIRRILAFFHPAFHILVIHYLKFAKKKIAKNRNLKSSECYIGHGLDTVWNNYFEYYDIYPLIEIEFEGSLFYAPHSTDAYLTTLFGNDYMTPLPESKRKPHSKFIKPIL